ncbi:MAG: hypothetical protein E7646_03670 [Ruminococcaceae bacterium]|nr:hypothetical protein [Oscillospiraceae bacterium]
MDNLTLAPDTATQCSKEPKKLKPIWIYILSFIIPFALMLAAFAVSNVVPFVGEYITDPETGEQNLNNDAQQILNFDFWHQYYPFLQILQDKLVEGGSLLYSWISGLGTNFISMIAYYIASPLNVLTLLVSGEWLREAVTFGVLIKIGLAGLFFSLFAKKTFDKLPNAIVVASSCLYALCNYATGYYWNIMWLDVFCIFPLVMLGTRELFLNSRFKLYTISIALSLLANYYIGYMVCVFVAISFIAYSLMYRMDLKTFFKKLGLFAIFSVIGCMISAILTVPAFIGLQSAGGTVASNGPDGISLYRGFEELFSCFMNLHDPTAIDGLPNVFCGLICIVMMFVFFWSTKIALKEKLVVLGVILFMFFSLNLNLLDYFWHGMHFPNQVPFRYGFIVSFMLIALMLRAYSKLENMDKWDVIGTGIFSVLFFIACYIAVTNDAFKDNLLDGMIILAINVALCAFYLVLLFVKQRNYIKTEGLTVLLCFVMILEILPQSFLGVKAVGTTSHTSYFLNQDNVNGVLEYAESLDTKDDLFYRVDFTKNWSCNDPALYGYNGVSVFSSTANSNVTSLMHALGMPADEASNRYCYMQNTPWANALLNLKYLMGKNFDVKDENYLKKLTVHSSISLYENTAYLPLGFMTQSSIADLKLNAINCFETQNDLFKLATGLDEDLITMIQLSPGEKMAGVTIRDVSADLDGGYADSYNYRYDTESGASEFDLVLDGVSEIDGIVYAYVTVPGAKDAEIFLGNELERTLTLESARVNQGLVYAGECLKGENFSMKAKIDSVYINGYCNIQIGVFNTEVFEKGMALLRDELLTLTSFNDDNVKGVVTANTDGILYTSIPYEKGWTVTVDGKKVDTVAIGGAFIGVELSAGAHSIEFSYCPEGFVPGVIISILGIALFIALCILTRKKPLWYAPVELPAVPEAPESTDTSEPAQEDEESLPSSESSTDIDTEAQESETVSDTEDTSKEPIASPTGEDSQAEAPTEDTQAQ